jgi:hypothetical protein
MKKSIRTSLIVIALVLVACLAGLVWLVSRSGESVTRRASDTTGSPTFEVNVDKPRMDRFLGGILPTRIEGKLLGGELRFNHASRGARIGSVAPNRIELGSEGWNLLIENDSEGRIAPGTRLVFPIEIAEKQYSLRCRPEDRANGFLEVTTRPASGELDGRFLIELARCENAATGKILDTEAGGSPGQAWPSSPLTLRGSFQGLPPTRP